MTLTLDSFLAGPSNELDWMAGTMLTDPEEANDNLEFLKNFSCGIMGFPTYVGMAAYWKHVAEDPQSSDKDRDVANVVNKYYAYVLSRKEESLPTTDSELILFKNDADIIHAVQALKKKVGKPIGVAGGVRTAQMLSRLGLIDEYILTIHPVVIGFGKPLFTSKIHLELVNSKTYKNGVIRTTYRPILTK